MAAVIDFVTEAIEAVTALVIGLAGEATGITTTVGRALKGSPSEGGAFTWRGFDHAHVFLHAAGVQRNALA